MKDEIDDEQLDEQLVLLERIASSAERIASLAERIADHLAPRRHEQDGPAVLELGLCPRCGVTIYGAGISFSDALQLHLRSDCSAVRR